MRLYTSFLMTASALFMATLGIAATFAPDEIARMLGENDRIVALLVQVGGALYLGFAMMNSMARLGLIGGIYNRPLLLGNLLHFVVAALGLMKAALSGPPMPLVRIAAVIYAAFAIGFSSLLFRSPVTATES